jgi:hypothetical protein
MAAFRTRQVRSSQEPVLVDGWEPARAQVIIPNLTRCFFEIDTTWLGVFSFDAEERACSMIQPISRKSGGAIILSDLAIEVQTARPRGLFGTMTDSEVQLSRCRHSLDQLDHWTVALSDTGAAGAEATAAPVVSGCG